jgi:hypothetical protein
MKYLPSHDHRKMHLLIESRYYVIYTYIYECLTVLYIGTYQFAVEIFTYQFAVEIYQ